MFEAKQSNFWENDPEEIESEKYSVPVEMTWEEAEKVVQETLAQIELKGWCLWRLRNLKGQEICLIRDYQIQDYPAGYPVFSLEEMKKLEDVPDKTFRLICHVKDSGDAIIESVEKIV
jgi:hypothetical protein